MKNLQTIVTNYKTEQDDFEKNILLAEIIAECESTFKYFCIKYRNLPMDSEDIRAELLIELIKAVDKYDLESGYEFKTFFSKYCNQRLHKLHRDLGTQGRTQHNEEGERVSDLSYNVMIENGYDVVESYCSYTDVETKMLLESLPLEDTEKFICERLALGYRPSEIADCLGLSPAMITYQVKKIREKFKTNLVFC